MPTIRRPVITRYFNQEGEQWANTINELKPLVRLVNASTGEYSLQLREDYLDIYYQGNAIAKVQPNKNGTYSVSIHRKFISNKLLERLDQYSEIKHVTKNESAKGYFRFRIKARDFKAFFQRSHVNSIISKIRAVHNGEEITMEQVIITDNPPDRDFIIIDRQVADHSNWSRIDLLAIKRDSTNEFHFVVIELKLGRNAELRGKAGKQVSDYVTHIKQNMADYIKCYQRNYCQKKQLGLFDDEMPDNISINADIDSVEGIVVACGYSQIASENITSLHKAIEKNRWNIEVHQMRPMKLS